VQLKLHGGTVFGEVGSRQWKEPERPLNAMAVAGLAALGFSGGGPEQNYVTDGLPLSAPQLAALCDTLFRTAYELDDEYAVSVHQLYFNDATLPRAEHFTRDMIERHLITHEVKFLRDPDGDFRADFFLDGMPGPVLLWLCAGGSEDSVYQVLSYAPSGPVPASREDALERCNEWNATHRWPKAYVHGASSDWHLATSFDIDLSAGLTQELLDSMTCAAASASLDFWKWLGTAQPSEPPKRRRRR
jgi:Putative bacterial sensory transduction regulator